MDDEAARFFTAGYFLRRVNMIVIREDAAPLQCVSKCIQLQKEHRRDDPGWQWVIIS